MMTARKFVRTLLITCTGLSIAIGFAGCETMDGDSHETAQHESMWNDVDSAVAVLHPTAGNTARGWVRFEKVSGGVRVTAEITGLSPNQKHGFHVHQYGDCSAPDGTSAGGHYNPEGHMHALPDGTKRHAGDMGNLVADANGVARFSAVFDNFTIAGMKNPVLGRGVIVHAMPDDGGQPTGNAGARVACGVIGIANPG